MFDPIAEYLESASAKASRDKPLDASCAAAIEVAGTKAVAIVAVIARDVTAEINFLICNNSFLRFLAFNKFKNGSYSFVRGDKSDNPGN